MTGRQYFTKVFLQWRLGTIGIILAVIALAINQVLVGMSAAGNVKNPSTQQNSTQQNRKIAITDKTGTYEDPIPLSVRKGIKVVYQVKSRERKNGIAAGLHYLNKLAKTYDQLGIAESDRQVIGVQIYLGDLPSNIDKIPEGRPVTTFCNSGQRAIIAASILKQHGIEPVEDCLGSISACSKNTCELVANQ